MSKNPVQTRLSILDAAGNLISRHGYCATTLEDILAAAAITKGAFYHYFKSKEDVCSTLLEQAVIFAKQCFSSSSDVNPYEAFEQWSSQLLDPNSEQGRAFRLVLRLTDEQAIFHSPIPERIALFWSEQLGGLEKIIALFKPTQLRPPNPRLAGLLLLTSLIGISRLEHVPGTAITVPAKTLMEAGLRLILS